MKPHSLAVRLLIFLFLLTLACGAAVGAQTVASHGSVPGLPPSGGAPASAEKKPAVIPAPAIGEMQQKQEAPPPMVAGAAPRPAESNTEPGQTNLEIRYDVQAVSVQGNTERSFLHACTRDQLLPFTPPARPRVCDSINTTSDVNFLNNVPVFGNYRFETSLVTRYTDNPRVDPERVSLQRGYLRLVGKNLEATLGDSLVSYSRFSFSQNIKGLHVWHQWTDRVRVIGTVGFFSDRWGSLYRPYTAFRDITLDCQRASTLVTPTTPGPLFAAATGCIEHPAGSQNFVVSPTNPSKPYSRFVAGLRMEIKAGKSGWLAFNYSRGKDLQQTLPDAVITCMDTTTSAHRVVDIGVGCAAGTEVEVPHQRFSTPEAANNHLYSVDTSLDVRPLRLKIVGEVAYSLTAGGTPPATAVTIPNSFACAAQSPVVGGAVLDSRCFSHNVGGAAYRAEVTQRIGKLNWRLDYSRFQPNFSSANARQIRDLQDFNVRGDYQFLRQFTLALSWRRSNDNLNGKRNYTSIVRAPEIRLTFRDLPFYRKFVLEVGYRERNQDTAGKPLAIENRVRSTRIPFFSLTLPVSSSSFNFDYEHRHIMDAVVRQNSSDTDRFAFGFRGNYTWNNWDVFPSFRYELERLAKFTTNDPSLSLTLPSLNYPIDFFSAHDSSRSFNALLQIEAPRYFRFEGSYREFNSISLSPLQISSAINPLPPSCVPLLPLTQMLGTCYLNQGFKRPNWRASLSYKFRNDENRLFTLYYERGNNFFDTGDPFIADLKSFRETIIGGTLLFRFRH